MTDPETGKPGKNIKLVQVKQQRPQQGQIFSPFGGGEDANMIKNIMGQFQSMVSSHSVGIAFPSSIYF